MGTRSLTTFKSRGTEIVVMYRQFDGYPEGHGLELAEFLAGSVMVNGLRDDNAKVHNGMGCLAASVVAHFKTEPGGFYLYPAGTRDRGEDYLYEVYGNKGDEPCITVTEAYGDRPALFDGPASQFVAEYSNKEV